MFGHKTYKFGSYPIPKPYHVGGSTMTVPDLAPSLRAIISASSVAGEPLPLAGKPEYDESDEAGMARLDLRSRDLSEIANIARSVQVDNESEKESVSEASTTDGSEVVSE